MRVVAGSARGRRLVAPRGDAVRPTSDRVREALFNALQSLDAIEGATFVDLFAGSGAMGIEALSRGAAHATFVDVAPAALAAVEANLDATGLAEHAEVVRADAVDYLRARTGSCDVVVADPPYAFDQWDDLLAAADASLVVVESDRPVDGPAGWRVVRQKRYGGTVVSMLRPVDPPAADDVTEDE